MKIVLMGYGRWGMKVARDLAGIPRARLVGIVDVDSHARARASEHHPGVTVEQRLEPFMDYVDLVAVCTPAVDHHEHARMALQGKKHVMVEKPMALTSKGAMELVDLAERSSLTFLVGHQMRYHKLFERILGIIHDRTLGDVRSISCERGGPIDLDTEPDVLWAYGPHDVAMVLAITDCDPSLIHSRGTLDAARGVIDEIEIGLEFPGSVKAAIRLDCKSDNRIRQMTIVFERGTVVFNDAVPGGKLTISGVGNESSGVREIAGPPDEPPLLLECRHLLECIVGGVTPLTDGRFGQRVTSVLERAAISFRSLQSP